MTLVKYSKRDNLRIASRLPHLSIAVSMQSMQSIQNRENRERFSFTITVLKSANVWLFIGCLAYVRVLKLSYGSCDHLCYKRTSLSTALLPAHKVPGLYIHTLDRCLVMLVYHNVTFPKVTAISSTTILEKGSRLRQTALMLSLTYRD